MGEQIADVAVFSSVPPTSHDQQTNEDPFTPVNKSNTASMAGMQSKRISIEQQNSDSMAMKSSRAGLASQHDMNALPDSKNSRMKNR